MFGSSLILRQFVTELGYDVVMETNFFCEQQQRHSAQRRLKATRVWGRSDGCVAVGTHHSNTPTFLSLNSALLSRSEPFAPAVPTDTCLRRRKE